MLPFERAITISPAGHLTLDEHGWMLAAFYEDLGYSPDEIAEMTGWDVDAIKQTIADFGFQHRAGLHSSLSDARCRRLAESFFLEPLRKADASDDDLTRLLRERLSDRIQLKGMDEITFRIARQDWRESIERKLTWV